MPPATPNRRAFLSSTAALPAAGTFVPYWLSGERSPAGEPTAKNDRPHVGVIGCGGRGSAIAKQAARFGELVAVCDVDRRQAERAKASFAAKADVYEDYRKLLERKDIDVVTNGTPDHWHTPVNIAACKAGKDVYTEKPLTLTIDEGKILCEVVRQTGRIVQVGTQQRSERQFQTAVELVRNRRIGRLRQVTVILPFWTTKGGPFTKQPVPEGLNWDFYQGQAPLRDYHPMRTHFNFRWWFEYAGGIINDWGNHHMDIAHWGMNLEHGGPLSVEAKAIFPNQGKPHHFNNPDRFVAKMVYPGNIDLLYFVARDDKYLRSMKQGDIPARADAELFAGLPDEVKQEKRNGIMFTGDTGRIFVNRGGVFGKPVEQLKENPLPDDAWRVYPSKDHMGNFFQCVKTRKKPVSPVEIQHRTITACHLGNIAIRLRRKIAWQPGQQQIIGDDEANALQKRQQRAPYLVEG